MDKKINQKGGGKNNGKIAHINITRQEMQL